MNRLIPLALLLVPLAHVGAAGYRTGCEPMTHEAWSTQFNTDGSVISTHDRAATYCFYDGQADLSEYRALGPQNNVTFHGVSVTIWDDARGRGRTLWAMVGVDGHTDIRLAWTEEGVLETDGDGHDPEGTFLERSRSRFQPGGDYRFEMDRSYNGGEDWIAPRNVIEYLRTPADPPQLPSAWSPRLPFAARLARPGGMIILDGMAWGRFIEDEAGRPSGFVFASVAPKDGAWVWRTLTWSSNDGVTGIEDQELQ